MSSSSPGRHLRPGAPSAEDEIEVEVRTSLQGIEVNLVHLVKELVAPLFVLFDFFERSDSVYEEIVDAFVKGKVI